MFNKREWRAAAIEQHSVYERLMPNSSPFVSASSSSALELERSESLRNVKPLSCGVELRTTLPLMT